MQTPAVLQPETPEQELHTALKSCNELGSSKTLEQFIADLQTAPGSHVPVKQHNKAFLDFLQRVIVCTEPGYQQSQLDALIREPLRFEYAERYMDLISDIIRELLREGKTNKLQTFGYSLEGDQTAASETDSVKVNFINLNKQCMITRNWEMVYQILGDRLFAHLYKEYTVFLRTRDESLVQVNGTNIFVYLNDRLARGAVEKPAEEDTKTAAKTKNIASHKYNLKSEKDDYTANINKGFWDDIVNRNRLFYCAHMNRKNAFFQKHILNSKDQSDADKTAKILEQILGFTRVRKSVKDKVTSIVEFMVRKQRTFDYNYYLTKNCPLLDNWREKKETFKKMAATPQRGDVYKVLFEADSKYRNVADFLSEWVAQNLPKWFFEGKQKKIFNKKVHQFVKFNRFEMFTRITVLDRFSIDQVGWLRFNAKSENARYFSNENRFVLWRVLKWLFEDVFISLLRCFFYVTEKQKEYSRIFYYRKAIWAMVMTMSIEDLQKDNLKAVQKQEMNHHCENNNFAPGKLRLIPKGDTFRPIMTFNRKIPHTKNMTTNKKLGYAHMMLKNLKSKMYKHAFGFAVFNYDDIMKKYEKFAQKWKANGSPKLYFVTMDIEKCYDNVDAEKVVGMLQKTDLLEKEYFIINCFVLKRKNNAIFERGTFKKQPMKNMFRTKFQKIGIDGGTYPTLYDILEDENDLNFKRTIIAEQEQRRKLLKKDLLEPLQYICKNNYITFNKKQYKQTKGIPQGLCVSYILSSFYYANLEDAHCNFLRRELIPGQADSNGKPNTDLELNCLMRLTDDYLLMTTNKNNAMLFIEKMHELSKVSNFKFNMKKLKTNFFLNLQKIGCVREQSFDNQNVESTILNWIGISINMETLCLMPNINVKKEAVLCTLNVNLQTSQSILWLKKKLKSFLMNNVSFYFRDTINSADYATQTLNKLYLAAAEKYIACCMEFKQYHAATTLSKDIDIKICQVVYVVIRSFFKYLVCNVRDSVFDRTDYHKFFKMSLRFFEMRFKAYKNYFNAVHCILAKKMIKLDAGESKFQIL